MQCTSTLYPFWPAFCQSKFKANFGVDSMPETAEHVAEKYQISRDDQDLFAIRSQQNQSTTKWCLAEEILPVTIQDRRKTALPSYR